MGFHSTLKRFKKIARDLEKKSNIKNKQEKDIVVENRVKNGLTDANHGNTIPIKTDGIHLLNSMFSFST
jgi:hypothetical protein